MLLWTVKPSSQYHSEHSLFHHHHQHPPAPSSCPGIFFLHKVTSDETNATPPLTERHLGRPPPTNRIGNTPSQPPLPSSPAAPHRSLGVHDTATPFATRRGHQRPETAVLWVTRTSPLREAEQAGRGGSTTGLHVTMDVRARETGTHLLFFGHAQPRSPLCPSQLGPEPSPSCDSYTTLTAWE